MRTVAPVKAEPRKVVIADAIVWSAVDALFRAAIVEAHSSICSARSWAVSVGKIELVFLGALVLFGEDVLVVFRCAKNVGDVVFFVVVVVPRHNVPFRVLEDRIDKVHLEPGALILIALVHSANLGLGSWMPVLLASDLVRDVPAALTPLHIMSNNVKALPS